MQLSQLLFGYERICVQEEGKGRGRVTLKRSTS